MTATNSQILSNRVQELLGEGWTLYGDPQMALSSNEVGVERRYAQALTKTS